MDQQRTIWTVIIAAVIVIMVVISAMAYQSTQGTPGRVQTTAVDYAPYHALTFDLNLPPLTDGRYMLWAVDAAGQYTLLNEFLVNASLFVTDLAGKPLPTTVGVPDYDLHQAASFVVSIENKEGTVTTPSATVVLQTRQRSGTNYTLAFPYDLSSSVGSFQLGTPTNGPDTQEAFGVWFTDPAHLTLPTPPTGWLYAAWVHYQSAWLPVGAFTGVDKSDDLALFSGPRSAPAVPGEDFLTNARNDELTFPLNLADGTSDIVVTLQPNGAVSKADRTLYMLPILKAHIAATAVPATAYDLERAEQYPNGVIRIITR